MQRHEIMRIPGTERRLRVLLVNNKWRSKCICHWERRQQSHQEQQRRAECNNWILLDWYDFLFSFFASVFLFLLCLLRVLKARIIIAFQLFCYFTFFVLYNYRRKFFVNLCSDYSSGWAAFTSHIFHFHSYNSHLWTMAMAAYWIRSRGKMFSRE